MRKKRNRLLTLFISLALGILLIWLVVKDFTASDFHEIEGILLRAKLGWLLFSAFLGMLSHISRAIRWHYTLEPLGIKTGFWNRWLAVMVNYLVNLAVPRMGEVSRCAVLVRYEGAAFDKAFGTLITERALDLLILLLLIAAFVLWQYDVVFSYLNGLFSARMLHSAVGLAVLIGLLCLLAGGLLFLKKSNHRLARRVRDFLRGLAEGIRAIGRMRQKGAFIGHTILIWGLYLMMAYVCYFALRETAVVPFAGVLGAFVLGGLTIIATQGGLGAYPIAIQQILLLYGIGATTGYAFGWLIWIAQTLMVLTLGFASLIALPLINKN